MVLAAIEAIVSNFITAPAGRLTGASVNLVSGVLLRFSTDNSPFRVSLMITLNCGGVLPFILTPNISNSSCVAVAFKPGKLAPAV